MTTKREPIREQWETFRALVIPADAPARQLIEMRRAFYAGAEALKRSMFDHLEDTGNPDDVTPNDEQFMEDVDADFQSFAEQVAKGVA